MAHLDQIQFELERGSKLLKSTTTMPDHSTLGFDDNPNNAVAINNDGEFLIAWSPLGTGYIEQNGNAWIKVSSDLNGLWIKYSSTVDGSTDEPIYLGVPDSDNSWMIVRDINDQFTALGLAGGLNDATLHFFRHEQGAYTSKSLMGNSIHTGDYFVDHDHGGYHIKNGQDILSDIVVLRKTHRGTHGIIAGNYYGRLALGTNHKDSLFHAYPEQEKRFAVTPPPFVDSQPTTNHLFTLPAEKGLAIATSMSFWSKTPNVPFRIQFSYEDSDELLYESQSGYSYTLSPQHVTSTGEQVIPFENPIAVDGGRSTKLELQFATPVVLELGITGQLRRNIAFQNLIVDNVATDRDIGFHEYSEAIDGNNHHTLHDGNLEWLTDEDGNPLQFTDYANELGTSDLIVARELELLSLHNGDNQIITDEAGNALDWGVIVPPASLGNTFSLDSTDNFFNVTWGATHSNSAITRNLILVHSVRRYAIPCSLHWYATDAQGQHLGAGFSSSNVRSHTIPPATFFGGTVQEQIANSGGTCTITYLARTATGEFHIGTEVSTLLQHPKYTAKPNEGVYFTGQIVTCNRPFQNYFDFETSFWRSEILSGVVLIHELPATIGSFLIHAPRVFMDHSPGQINDDKGQIEIRTGNNGLIRNLGPVNSYDHLSFIILQVTWMDDQWKYMNLGNFNYT